MPCIAHSKTMIDVRNTDWLWTVQDLAQACGCSGAWIREFLARGDVLIGIKLSNVRGAPTLIDDAEARRFIDWYQNRPRQRGAMEHKERYGE